MLVASGDRGIGWSVIANTAARLRYLPQVRRAPAEHIPVEECRGAAPCRRLDASEHVPSPRCPVAEGRRELGEQQVSNLYRVACDDLGSPRIRDPQAENVPGAQRAGLVLSLGMRP